MIAIIDYGMGNLRSVQKALEKNGAKAVVTDRAAEIARAEKVVLPGVGAIQPAMEKLQALNLVGVIKDAIASGKPFLGICLGFQLLFEKSDEGGEVNGLGILPGKVQRFPKLKVPQMGWNQIILRQKNNPLMKDIEDKAHVYFCHSYYVQPQRKEITLTTTDYGIEYASSVAEKNLFGVQFHPEKSQTVGLKILGNFAGLKA